MTTGVEIVSVPMLRGGPDGVLLRRQEFVNQTREGDRLLRRVQLIRAENKLLLDFGANQLCVLPARPHIGTHSLPVDTVVEIESPRSSGGSFRFERDSWSGHPITLPFPVYP